MALHPEPHAAAPGTVRRWCGGARVLQVEGGWRSTRLLPWARARARRFGCLLRLFRRLRCGRRVDRGGRRQGVEGGHRVRSSVTKNVPGAVACAWPRFGDNEADQEAV